MPILKDILYKVSILQVVGTTDATVSRLQIDSRKVSAGDCFIALRGTAADGHNFIAQCIDRGASVIICEETPTDLIENVTYVKVRNSTQALGVIAGNFFENPSSRLKVVGVTGTNGKTSTVTLLFRLFRALGKSTGLLSTVQNQINDEIIPSTHTTPDAISLNSLLKQMADRGCEYCFMEVSSHAVDQCRIEGLQFAGGVFTNITHDHLDYHKTFENYLKAKKRFFDELPPAAFALSNADDKNGSVVLQNTKGSKHYYSLRNPSEFKTRLIENTVSGLHLEVDGTEMYTRLIGEFNASNVTAVYATACLLGVAKQDCLAILSSLAPPEGRFDQIVSAKENVTGIVDYAHTPDALKKVLQTIQAIRHGNEKVLTVVGCGGDRDAAKRPVMAEIACRFSNQVVFTSDNPRGEEAEEILKQMNAGVPASDKKKVLTISDRREAIRTAVRISAKGDIILLAGKGHEKYQEIKGIKYPFDDKKELMETFDELGK